MIQNKIIEICGEHSDKSACTTKKKRQVRENSYINVINKHVKALNVSDDEQKFYSKVHSLMAEAGIIDSTRTADASKSDKRYKPFANSPYGEFVSYETVDGKRKHVNSYLLNKLGMERVNEILQNYITSNTLDKDGFIPSSKEFRNKLKEQMDIELLESYLEYKGIECDDNKKDRIVFRAPSMENENVVIPYTSYRNNPTKVQFAKADKKKDYSSVFWLIHSLEVPVLCNDAQEKAKRAARIFREYWNLQFNGKTEWGMTKEEKTSDKTSQSTPQSTNSKSASEDSESQVDGSNVREQINNLEAMVKQQQLEMENQKILLLALMKHLNCGIPDFNPLVTASITKPKQSVKTTILNKIMELVSPLTLQKRYKTISKEEIVKEKKPERKKLLQQAYDYLDARRLLRAKYKPHDGWKFNFNRKSIELLYRLDTRKSAVYNTRHRPLTPRVEDGKVLKEVATAGEKYTLPYGLEKLDYSYKTIFVTEGIFDSCFLKNCLAYSNWTCPTGMNKVIQMFRDHGYQIIHILDNFQEGDKGGRRGLDTMVRSHDWLQQGDRVFDWSPFTGCKDLNDVAVKYELDEIDPQTIIANSWNEEEVLSYYRERFSDGKKKEEEMPTSAKQDNASSSFSTKEALASNSDAIPLFMKQQEETETSSVKKTQNSDESNHDGHQNDMDDFMKERQEEMELSTQNAQPSTISETGDKESVFMNDDELEEYLKELEEEQKAMSNLQSQRKYAYEAAYEKERKDFEASLEDFSNPKSHLYKTSGITITRPRIV